MKFTNSVFAFNPSMRLRIEIILVILLYVVVNFIARTVEGIEPSLINLPQILTFCWLGLSLSYKALLLAGVNVKPLGLVSLITLVAWYIVVVVFGPDRTSVNHGGVDWFGLVAVFSFALWVAVDVPCLLINKPSHHVC